MDPVVVGVPIHWVLVVLILQQGMLDNSLWSMHVDNYKISVQGLVIVMYCISNVFFLFGSHDKDQGLFGVSESVASVVRPHCCVVSSTLVFGLGLMIQHDGKDAILAARLQSIIGFHLTVWICPPNDPHCSFRLCYALAIMSGKLDTSGRVDLSEARCIQIEWESFDDKFVGNPAIAQLDNTVTYTCMCSWAQIWMVRL